MNGFALKFEKMLVRENEAASLVTRIVARGTLREDLIILLEAATDPKADQNYRKAYMKLRSQLPSRKRISGLAVRMERVAREIEEVFGNPFYELHPKSRRFTEMATLLRTEAVTAKKFPQPKIGKLFSPKSLWKHVPVALLYARLDVPHRTSYADAHNLLWYAFLARGIEDRATSDRAVERELGRFKRSAAGKFFYTFFLPQFLNALNTPAKSKYRRWARMIG